MIKNKHCSLCFLTQCFKLNKQKGRNVDTRTEVVQILFGGRNSFDGAHQLAPRLEDSPCPSSRSPAPPGAPAPCGCPSSRVYCCWTSPWRSWRIHWSPESPSPAGWPSSQPAPWGSARSRTAVGETGWLQPTFGGVHCCWGPWSTVIWIFNSATLKYNWMRMPGPQPYFCQFVCS